MSARSARIRTTIAVRRKLNSKAQMPVGRTATPVRAVQIGTGSITPLSAVAGKVPATNPMRDLPLKEYLHYWLRTAKRGTVKPTTYDTLERVVISYIQDSSIGSVPISAVMSDDIQALLGKLREQDNYSYSTVKKVYDCLGASFKYAVQRQIITDNPMAFVTMPSRALFQASEITYFSPSECSLILEECFREHSTGVLANRYGPVYALLLLTGLRLGEVLGLHKDDFDPAHAVLRVRRSICKVRKRDDNGNLLPGFTLEETTPKSYSGTREVPLTPQAVQAVQMLMSLSPYASEYLVTNGNGNMPSPEQIGRSFRNLLRNVSLPSSGVHKLRHTYASLLFAAKVDLKTISRLLGHASATITLSTYIHIADRIPHSAVSPLEDLFEPKSA